MERSNQELFVYRTEVEALASLLDKIERPATLVGQPRDGTTQGLTLRNDRRAGHTRQEL